MSAEIVWSENQTPHSTRFDDTYFSRHGGRDEVRHVFLAGNRLPDRFEGRDRFVIAELGFGTGLNFLESQAVWLQTTAAPAVLDYVSVERHPVAIADIMRTHEPWPDLGPGAAALCSKLDYRPGWVQLEFERVRLHLGIGDAADLVPAWTGQADAWYLDGFDPRKNPAMWDAALMRAVFEKTRPCGRFATYTAAGWVRRTLASVGFNVRKSPGFGTKRDMTVGFRPDVAESRSAGPDPS
ncbi:MAG: tRNA (5-methylaminomethyl-2-thiouridine)(34)-methyltransferase MnmD [Pseudomonadota bacterium]